MKRDFVCSRQKVHLDTIISAVFAAHRQVARTIIQSVENRRNDVAMSLPTFKCLVGAGTQNQQKNLSSLCNGLENPRIE